jgi:hypothetical protein
MSDVDERWRLAEQEAERLRQEGNESFKCKQFSEAIKHYTKVRGSIDLFVMRVSST